MKLSSQHIPFATLADLADNRAPADERAASLAHVAACSSCAAELERLSQVVELMRTDTATDAPRDVIAYAVNTFQRKASQPSRLRRIIAAISFDSDMNMAPAFGVRSGQATVRQLLYSAEESDIDLRISSQNDQWIIAGQLLGGDCVGGRIELEGENGLTAAELNDLCEFRLPPMPSGTYTFRLLLADSEVEFPQLELRK